MVYMAIPKYTEFMSPLLEWLKDGDAKEFKAFTPFIIDKLNISSEDQNMLLSSGQPLFENRYGWARTYLKKAGLIESPQRGIVKITQRGINFQLTGKKINSPNDLNQYPEYVEWRNKKTITDEGGEDNININESSPEEIIEASISNLNEVLVDEILDKVKAIPPKDFEYLVVKLLTLMGYGASLKNAGVVVGKSGDGGIDGIISEDRLGLSKIYVQAKRWEGNVGDIDLRNFIGSMSSKGANKGVFISTSDYTKQAKETIERNKSSMEIVLINGKDLASLMIEFNLGVSVVSTYQIKNIDSDFFE